MIDHLDLPADLQRKMTRLGELQEAARRQYESGDMDAATKTEHESRLVYMEIVRDTPPVLKKGRPPTDQQVVHISRVVSGAPVMSAIGLNQWQVTTALIEMSCTFIPEHDPVTDSYPRCTISLGCFMRPAPGFPTPFDEISLAELPIRWQDEESYSATIDGAGLSINGVPSGRQGRLRIADEPPGQERNPYGWELRFGFDPLYGSVRWSEANPLMPIYVRP